jgi:hypothetical protein
MENNKSSIHQKPKTTIRVKWDKLDANNFPASLHSLWASLVSFNALLISPFQTLSFGLFLRIFLAGIKAKIVPKSTIFLLMHHTNTVVKRRPYQICL